MNSTETTQSSRFRLRLGRELELFILFLLIWLVIFLIAYRNVLTIGQFVFSEQNAIPTNADIRYLSLFFYSWNPYGIGSTIPSVLTSFYATQANSVWSDVTGIGAAWGNLPDVFFMGVVFALSPNNPDLAQHLFYYPLIPLSGVTMYFFMSRFRLAYPSRVVASFVYCVNSITVMAFLGGGPEKMTFYAMEPLILNFMFNVLDNKPNRIRSALLMSAVCAFAASFSDNMAFLTVLVGLALASYVPFATTIGFKDRVFGIIITIAAFALVILLISPFSFFLIWKLLQSSSTSIIQSINAKYSIQSLISSLQNGYSASTPINLFRLQFLTGSVPSWWYSGSGLSNVFGFATPILAFSSWLVLRRTRLTRYGICFSVLVVVPIAFVWATHFGLTVALFAKFPLLLVFDSPEYLLWISAVGMASMVGLTLSILENNLLRDSLPNVGPVNSNLYRIRKARRWKGLIVFMIIFIVSVSSIAIYNWPFFTGDMGMASVANLGYQVPSENYIISPSYNSMRDWLAKNDNSSWDWRVLVLPSEQGYQTSYSEWTLGVDFLPAPQGIVDELLNNKTDNIGVLLAPFNVKYILLNTGTNTSTPLYPEYEKQLSQQRDLRLDYQSSSFLVYLNMDFVPVVSVYNQSTYVEPSNASTMDELSMLSVLPGFNFQKDLFVFGENRSNDANNWAYKTANSIAFFGNSTALTFLNPKDDTSAKSAFYIFKAGRDLMKTPYSAAEFDGSTGYIVVPNSTLGSLSQMTLNVWVYSTRTSTGAIIGTPGLYSTLQPAYGGGTRLDLNDRWYTALGTCPSLQSQNPSSPLDQWVDVTVTYNGTYLATYLDGTLVSSAKASNGTLSMNGSIYFGSFFGKANFLSGYLRDIELYGNALTQAQIQQLNSQIDKPIASADLLGWWPLDQTSGTIARDLSGHDNNGVLVGGVTWEVSGPSLLTTKNPSASLGYGLDIASGEKATAVFSVAKSGNYSIALRASVNPNASLSVGIDGFEQAQFTSAIPNLQWFNATLHLTEGTHQIEVTSNSAFIDELALSNSAQPSLLFGSPDNSSENSYTASQSSWVDYNVRINSPGTQFIVLWQANDQGWTAETPVSRLTHFNTSWPVVFELNSSKALSVHIFFGPQSLRTSVILVWIITWMWLVASVIYLSRTEMLTKLRLRRLILKKENE